MQTDILILAGLLLVVIVLQLVLLLRRNGNSELENVLRREQRNGRSELRELLEAMARQQDARMDGFSRNLTDLSTRTDLRLDLLRDSLNEDARKGREENGLVCACSTRRVSCDKRVSPPIPLTRRRSGDSRQKLPAYSTSPRIGWPMAARCTRNWCERPVTGSSNSRVLSLLAS